MVDKAIYLEDAIPQVFAFAPNTFLESLHRDRSCDSVSEK
jgi:hypothetical protein